ncbi:MAG: hypothetical protein J2P55_02255 [Rhizobiales bacterium]|nr:hypothetical protein [Hyphomicrobiales bacterium]
MAALLEKRADHMVTDALREAEARANAFQGSRQMHPGIKHARTIRHRQPLKIASASLIAKFMESVMFKRLDDFFGEW